ncbi:MAG: peptide-methionine (S)-S-oxide reductase MsrA [Cyanobacteria bacterium P01_D01_bin.44]
MKLSTLLGILLSFLIGWGMLNPAYAQAATPALASTTSATDAPEISPSVAKATFAGGCFWCMEHPFDQLGGVLSTTSGYTGGDYANPSYSEVSSGMTGHLESVKISYDPAQVSYEQLLSVFWHNIDPLDERGQFCDKGSQYRSAVFYHDEQQQQLAEVTKQDVAEQFDHPVATEILPAQEFYAAEDYHQNYYQTHPVRYRVYRFGCGRDQRLTKLWGNPHE